MYFLCGSISYLARIPFPHHLATASKERVPLSPPKRSVDQDLVSTERYKGGKQTLYLQFRNNSFRWRLSASNPTVLTQLGPKLLSDTI